MTDLFRFNASVDYLTLLKKPVSGLIFMALLLIAGPISAQEPLSLHDAIRIGLENNYDIRIARKEVEVSENNLNYVAYGMLPSAEARITRNFTRNNTRDQFGNNPVREIDGARTSNLNAGINLDWIIFDGFDMFITPDRLRAIEQSGELLSQVTVENTVARITDAYFEVVRQDSKIAALQDALAISQERINLTQARYDVGVAAKVEILAARVDFNADQSAILFQEELLQNSKIALNNLLARPPHTDFVPTDSITVAENMQYEALANRSISVNPALRRTVVNRELANLELKSIRSLRYPTVGLTGGYGLNRSERNPAFFGAVTGTNQNRSLGFNYGFTVGVPIFDGFTIRRQAQNARILIESSDLAYQQIRNNLEADVAASYNRYANRLRMLALEQDNVLLARQNADIALERYKLGLLTALELREAQRNELVATNRLIDIRYEAKQAETELLRLSSSIITNQ